MTSSRAPLISPKRPIKDLQTGVCQSLFEYHSPCGRPKNRDGHPIVSLCPFEGCRHHIKRLFRRLGISANLSVYFVLLVREFHSVIWVACMAGQFQNRVKIMRSSCFKMSDQSIQDRLVRYKKMAQPTGFEPVTFGIGIER